MSFEQSASCEYFRRVFRDFSPPGLPHVLVNPDPDALFNLATAVPEAGGGGQVIQLALPADTVVERLRDAFE